MARSLLLAVAVTTVCLLLDGSFAAGVRSRKDRPPCTDFSHSCVECVDNRCYFAYVTMEDANSQLPARYLPHGCVSKEEDDIALEEIKRQPSWELSTPEKVLQGLVRVANEYDSHIAFVSQNTREVCIKVVDPPHDELPGETGQEKITLVINTAIERYDNMRDHMTPLQKARDRSTWIAHVFDDEIDAACDELLRMTADEREAMGLAKAVRPSMDLLPGSSHLGAYMLARQIRRLLGHVAQSTGKVDSAHDHVFNQIVDAGRLAAETSCRYLNCLVDMGSAVVYDDLMGSDDKPLGRGLGLPCRYCRKLSRRYYNAEPAISRQARVLVNGVCSAMRKYNDEKRDNDAAVCLTAVGQTLVHVLMSFSEALDDFSSGTASALDTAVTALTLKMTETGACQMKVGHIGHWEQRISPDYRKDLQDKQEELTELLDNIKANIEHTTWRSKGVTEQSTPNLYPQVDLKPE